MNAGETSATFNVAKDRIPLTAIYVQFSDGGSSGVRLPDGRLILAGSHGIETYSSADVLRALYPSARIYDAPPDAQEVVNAVSDPAQLRPKGL